MMKLEELMEEIKRKRLRRDLLQSEVNSLRGSIVYYLRKEDMKKVEKLGKKLVRVKKEYNRAREELNRLYELWRENFGGKAS